MYSANNLSPAIVTAKAKTANSATMSPSVQPAPQWLTPVAVIAQVGFVRWFRQAVFTRATCGLEGRPKRRYPQMASGPKYRVVAGQTASITPIGWR